MYNIIFARFAQNKNSIEIILSIGYIYAHTHISFIVCAQSYKSLNSVLFLITIAIIKQQIKNYMTNTLSRKNKIACKFWRKVLGFGADQTHAPSTKA